MLDMMRRHSESFLIYLIFGAIIIVFAINFGPGSGSCSPSRTGYAAVVDGDVIAHQTFGVLYQRRVEDFRRRLQMANLEFTNEMVEAAGIKSQVIDGLINNKLLAHEAERRGMVVTGDELVEYLGDRFEIHDMSAEEYRRFVENYFQTTVPRFEESVREEILAGKMEMVVQSGISVSDPELKEQYLREHDCAMITFVKLDPDKVKVPAPTQAEIDQLLADDMPAVEAKYNAEVLKFRTPMRVEARQIVRKLPPDASDADVAKARGELLDLKAQIEGGADFATLAKQSSDDAATAAAGGDMGEIVRGKLPKPLDEAVFSLKKDEMVAEPVRTKDGLHLVQVTEIYPPARRKLDDVKQEVAAELLQERAGRKVAEAEAGELLAKLKAGAPLENLTVEQGSDVKDKPVRRDSAWVLKSQEAIPGIGMSKELHEAIFALTKEQPVANQVFEVNKDFYVVKLKEREAPDLTKFESDKDSLRTQAVQVKRNRVLRDWLQYLRQRARIEYNPALFPPSDNNQPA